MSENNQVREYECSLCFTKDFTCKCVSKPSKVYLEKLLDEISTSENRSDVRNRVLEEAQCAASEKIRKAKVTPKLINLAIFMNFTPLFSKFSDNVIYKRFNKFDLTDCSTERSVAFRQLVLECELMQ